jgi:alcohol dehydrogenase class IV
MAQFEFEARIPRVVFGIGSVQTLPREIDRLGARRALVLSTPNHADAADRIGQPLGNRLAGLYSKAMMHVPIESAREARAEARRLGADCVVAIGGGSTTGLGKAIALEPSIDSPLPIVCIPTTYAGSEMTPIYGITDAGVKKTGRDPRVLPRTVIYDPELTLALPLRLTMTSSLNAIAHAAEGLYARDTNPIVGLMAEEGIRAAAQAMHRLAAQARDIEARSNALYAAWLCGVVLGHVSMGLHHKLCHALGGTFNLPHAELHAVILPHALAYNARHAPQAMQRIAGAVLASGASSEASDAPALLYDLARRHGAALALKDLGMPRDGLERAVDLAVKDQYPNPRPLERAAIRELIERAYEGVRPL